MTNKRTDSEDTRMMIAVLFAALVHSLDKTNLGLEDRFLDHLNDTYHLMKGHEVDPLKVKEAIAWTAQLVRRP